MFMLTTQISTMGLLDAITEVILSLYFILVLTSAMAKKIKEVIQNINQNRDKKA